jgi:hypothetical protein
VEALGVLRNIGLLFVSLGPWSAVRRWVALARKATPRISSFERSVDRMAASFNGIGRLPS